MSNTTRQAAETPMKRIDMTQGNAPKSLREAGKCPVSPANLDASCPIDHEIRGQAPNYMKGMPPAEEL